MNATTEKPTEDATAIQEWLARESAARSDFVVPQTEDLGVRKWQLRGILPAENWSVEVECRKSEPGLVSVRLLATEPGHVRGEIEKFNSVFLDHGVIPCCSQLTGYGLNGPSVLGMLERPDAFLARMATMTPDEITAQPGSPGMTQATQWGAQQVLAVNCLPTGLLRGVLARLFSAMQAAAAKRSRGAA